MNETHVLKPSRKPNVGQLVKLLWRDKFAFFSATFLLLVVLSALLGPMLFGGATAMNLRARNLPPGSIEQGWEFILGSDSLGRSILSRIILGARNSMLIATCAVVLSMTIGVFLGLVAGFRGGRVSAVILRLADILMSFPSLLLALIVLYVFSPSLVSMIFVLAITRVPIYLRTTRAEVLEIRERMFVASAQVMGASGSRIIRRHILPMAAPTIVTLATLDCAYIMVAEASLSFLGLGIQPPDITWGLMVAEGRDYLRSAWWLSFWPGLAITLTAMSLNLLSNWVRTICDPAQRWRVDAVGTPK